MQERVLENGRPKWPIHDAVIRSGWSQVSWSAENHK